MIIQDTTGSAKDVDRVTAEIIHRFESQRESGTAKAALAELRRSAGQSFAEAQAVWPMLLAQMPESMLSSSGEPTAEENAVFAALQFYALCQQGSRRVSGLPESDKPAEANEKRQRLNMGASLRTLRSDANEKALDRRFNAMLTAESFDELAYHLRQLIKLAKAAGVRAIDFPQLAEDLFWFQRGSDQQVKLRWATAYYRMNQDDKETKQEEASHAE
ncbi:type I-E CRISPR-associated protein Cse2/CasB [Pseudoramibacter faecis]|uniref:type I-E CRISPR-associated protein Cse2/CasB n=1 Tax=Pseudoramibacter faecis TaxID=3108534 RepID=UPI002E7A0D8F|nr:type I-E CRISPR-associated protein Cse2/CasB [Pseudoramibacter sp. HA2172]